MAVEVDRLGKTTRIGGKEGTVVVVISRALALL